MGLSDQVPKSFTTGPEPSIGAPSYKWPKINGRKLFFFGPLGSGVMGPYLELVRAHLVLTVDVRKSGSPLEICQALAQNWEISSPQLSKEF